MGRWLWWTIPFLGILVSACTGTQTVVDSTPPASERAALFPLIPIPQSVSLSNADHFVFTDATPILVDARDSETERVAGILASLVGSRADSRPPISQYDGPPDQPYVRLTRASADAGLGDEGYALIITRDSLVLSAPQPAGLFYGIQTIRQLLPYYVEYTAALPQPLTLPVGRVEDRPRFSWRGSMLDVARHFFPVEAVERYLDLMALHKLNTLHLHLSDDQGWRIEIASRPQLTAHGASTEVGGGEGGFYTQEDYARLVRYARDRFITIVPEIDMPGHTNSALASYPELTCDGEPRELYTGIEVGFSYLCVEKEETYAFVDDVVRELAALTPGSYFHLGGDEVHELTPEQYVTFMERVQQIVASHGKRVVGWDEIAEADLALLPGTAVQVWRPQWDSTATSIADAVASGARVILSPAERIYIDMKYDSTTAPGLAWAGFSDVRDSYDWSPDTFVPGIPESAILGVEAPLWAETLDSIYEIEYMAFPRLAGVAELGWSRAESLNWNDYRLRLAAQSPRWTALGINFYRAPEIPWVHE